MTRPDSADAATTDIGNYLRLVDLAIEYHDQAEACARAGCFHAACVMIGAALEAELLVLAILHRPALEANGGWPSGKRAGRSPEHWGLNELVTLALDAGWLSSTTSTGDPVTHDEIIDITDFVREVRNRAAHPGRLVSNAGVGMVELGSETYRLAYDIVRSTFNYTYAHLQQTVAMTNQ